MSFWKETKRFFREVNKKLVEVNPISSVPPFNKVKDQPTRGMAVEVKSIIPIEEYFTPYPCVHHDEKDGWEYGIYVGKDIGMILDGFGKTAWLGAIFIRNLSDENINNTYHPDIKNKVDPCLEIKEASLAIKNLLIPIAEKEIDKLNKSDKPDSNR